MMNEVDVDPEPPSRFMRSGKVSLRRLRALWKNIWVKARSLSLLAL